MKNFEKFKTAEERSEAFRKFCTFIECKNCKLGNSRSTTNCSFSWLELEAEENLMPCPFCGSKEISLHRSINNFWYVECNVCTAKSAQNVTMENAIANYNGVAKAVADAKERETKHD